MTFDKTISGTKLIASVEGRLDTATAPKLEAELFPAMEGMTEVRLDFKKLEYISSAGLRVLLAAHKAMTAKKGSLTITNANETVTEVFDITGFADILNIENDA